MAMPRISIAALARRKAAALGTLWASSSPLVSAPAAPAATAACLLCQWRSFRATPSVREDARPKKAVQEKSAAATASADPAQPPPPGPEASAAAPPDAPTAPPEMPSPLADAPRSFGKRVDDFTPTPLSRPIGMRAPPVAGENSGIDARTLKEKRDDFVNYEKHLVRRNELKAQISKPYFRDWTNLKFHEGKTFIAPPRLFRGDVSLYFPNLVGERLLSADKALASSGQNDTTPLFEQSAATVVAFFGSLWAENQVRSFVSPQDNPELARVLAENSGPGQARLMHINYEDNATKAWLVRRFKGSLRRRIHERDWEQYLLVTQGVSDDIRENIGLLNSKVGYVYLVDQNCRIRWAGSGPSQPEERQSLAKGVQRLLADARRSEKM